MAVGSVLRRAGWIFLAALFILTGLGVGVWGFWQFINQPTAEEAATSQTAKLTCASDPSIPEPAGGAKLAGTKLPGFTPISKIDTLQCVDIKTGSGAEVSSSSNVTVNYTGAIAADGIIFESSLDSGQPAAFPLSQVIRGWSEGLPGMKAGGQRRLLIPAALAYGSSPPPGSGIPADADLVFDITLLDTR
jgi:FKBP-type peptidyl-prolyl cis-trans isomerase